jgi:hypothetical protein
LHLLSTLSSSSSTPLLADVHLHDLPLELIPLESDLLSLEDPRAWSRIWRDGDLGGLHETALACMTLQHLWGAFPRIVGKGDAAQVRVEHEAPAVRTSTMLTVYVCSGWRP